jgi:protein arginine kinase
MIDLSLLPDRGSGWLDASGDQADIVLSTRIRLARNLDGFSFAQRARDGERLRILAQVKDAAESVPSLMGSMLVRVDELPVDDRLLLHEHHLVSRELAAIDTAQPLRSGAAVFLSSDVSVMVNEEDHLRIQCLKSGFATAAAYAATERLDNELGRRVPYSFHPEFGFLTACPTNDAWQLLRPRPKEGPQQILLSIEGH